MRAKTKTVGRPPKDSPPDQVDRSVIADRLRAGLAERVSGEIARRGWAIPKTARAAGIAPGTLRRVLDGTGIPAVDVVVALAVLFGVSTGWLAEGVPPAERRRS